jgi:hypothetical protein
MDRRGEIVRRFLQAPLNQSRFREFFELCHASTIGLLKYYRSRGYPVPIERADLDNALSDLAFTLLGEFLASGPDQPYELIFDYYTRHGVGDFESTPAGDLYDHFRVLLSGYIKKQLFWRRKTENPQAEILKRRIKDILQPPAFERSRGNPGEHVMVSRGQREGTPRKNAPAIPFAALVTLVHETFLESNTRTAWCRAVFTALEGDTTYGDAVPLNELLLAMVQVNAGALEELVPQPTQPVSPEFGPAWQTVDRVVGETVMWARREAVPVFVKRGRLGAEDAEAYLDAVGLYLRDLGYCGDTDPIPQYFREVMPRGSQDRYIKHYKYTFEAVISSSADHFRERLAKEMT